MCLRRPLYAGEAFEDRRASAPHFYNSGPLTAFARIVFYSSLRVVRCCSAKGETRLACQHHHVHEPFYHHCDHITRSHSTTASQLHTAFCSQVRSETTQASAVAADAAELEVGALRSKPPTQPPKRHWTVRSKPPAPSGIHNPEVCFRFRCVGPGTCARG